MFNERAGSLAHDSVGGGARAITGGSVSSTGLVVDGTNDVFVIADAGAAKYQFASFTYSVVSRSVGSLDQFDCLLGVTDSTGTGVRLWTRSTSSHKYYFEGYDGASKQAISTTSISTSARQHIVGTYDGVNLRLYVDGNLEATTACGAIQYGAVATVGSAIAAMPLTTSASAWRRFWPGTIESAMIFDRALSPSEVRRMTIDPYSMFRRPGQMPVVFDGGGGGGSFSAAWVTRRNAVIGGGVI